MVGFLGYRTEIGGFEFLNSRPHELACLRAEAALALQYTARLPLSNEPSCATFFPPLPLHRVEPES